VIILAALLAKALQEGVSGSNAGDGGNRTATAGIRLNGPRKRFI
jgi:hypothetical protein